VFPVGLGHRAIFCRTDAPFARTALSTGENAIRLDAELINWRRDIIGILLAEVIAQYQLQRKVFGSGIHNTFKF
jgi:hypothetical protein